MRTSCAVVLATAASLAAAQNVVRFDLSKAPPGSELSRPHPLVRRDTHAQTAINNVTGGGYYVEVEVGSPGQRLSLVLDTGSSDAWVVSREADLCTNKTLQQEYSAACGATYDHSKSSSYKMVAEDGFSIKYLDQSSASGDYISDDFSIAGVTIKDLQMGYVTKTVTGTGILGVGYPADESTNDTYPNLLDQLVDQGLIKSKVFSLWLNDGDSSSGSILFGGVDKQKFIGELVTLPNLISGNQYYKNYTAFAVTMDSLDVSDGAGKTSSVSLPDGGPVAAILDSGTTLSYFPEDMADSLFDTMDAYTDNDYTGLALVDCRYLTSYPDMTFDFGFGNGSRPDVTIKVPVSELVLDVLAGYTLPPGIPFSDPCVLGVQSGGSLGSSSSFSYALLGDTFLRSAYVVYDLAAKQVGLAQANLNTTTSDVVELPAERDSIPALSGVSAQQTTATTGPSATAAFASVTTTADPAAHTTTTSSSSSSSTHHNAAASPVPPVAALVSAALAVGLSVFGGALFAL